MRTTLSLSSRISGMAVAAACALAVPIVASAAGSSMPTLAGFNPDSERQRWNIKTP